MSYKPEKIACPFCLNASDVIKKGKDRKGRQRYYCKWCKRSFVDPRGLPLIEEEFELLKKHTDLDAIDEITNKIIDLKWKFIRTMERLLELPDLPSCPSRLSSVVKRVLYENDFAYVLDGKELVIRRGWAITLPSQHEVLYLEGEKVRYCFRVGNEEFNLPFVTELLAKLCETKDDSPSVQNDLQ